MGPLLFVSVCALFSVALLFKRRISWQPCDEIRVGLFHVTWYTQRWNRYLAWCGKLHRTFILAWFSFGALASVLLLLPSTLFFVYILVNNLRAFLAVAADDPDKASTPDHSFGVLVPVVPGLSIPFSMTGYFVSAMLLCTFVHESGHAVAAASEDVPMHGAGLSLVLVMITAYVDLPTQELNAVRPIQKLRIFTAGIWNNLVLALLAYVLYLATPTLVSPLYSRHSAITVLSVEANSSLTGPSGLQVGDVITAVNLCPVRQREDWFQCLSQVHQGAVQGYCVTDHDQQRGLGKCCLNNSVEEYSDSLCFKAMDGDSSQATCLQVRATVDRAASYCNATTPCAAQEDCLQPQLSPDPAADNVKLLQVRRRANKDFLFLGHVTEVVSFCSVSDFVAEFSWLPLRLPSVIQTWLHWVYSISIGLAVVNVVPSFFLDGQFMMIALMQLCFPSASSSSSGVLLLTCNIIGSLLIALNLLLSLFLYLTT